ncbi:MAG: sigma-70 family RNA polymerase sigma factor [Verrucomicrobiota bacterium]
MKSVPTAKKTKIESNPEEEAVWLRAVANGDRIAFRQLHDRFKGVIYTTIYKVLNDHQDTEDVMQEVFAQIWQKAKLFDSQRGKPLTWCTTMARNRAIDRIRSKQRRARLRDALEEENKKEEPLTTRDSLDVVTANETSGIVRTAVMELSDEQREAIELAYFAGLTQNEVADRLGEPLGTIKARIRRGITKLQGKVRCRVDDFHDQLSS